MSNIGDDASSQAYAKQCSCVPFIRSWYTQSCRIASFLCASSETNRAVRWLVCSTSLESHLASSAHTRLSNYHSLCSLLRSSPIPRYYPLFFCSWPHTCCSIFHMVFEQHNTRSTYLHAYTPSLSHNTCSVGYISGSLHRDPVPPPLWDDVEPLFVVGKSLTSTFISLSLSLCMCVCIY